MSERPTTDAPRPAPDRCPHCGYAMTPELDRVCPRCKQAPDAVAAPGSGPVAPRAPFPPVAPLTPPPPTPDAGGSGARPPGTRASRPARAPLTPIISVVVAAVIALTMAGVRQHAAHTPRGRAAAAYSAGGHKLLSSDFAGATEEFKKALEIDATMAEASFGVGLATLGVSDRQATEASLEKLLEQAKSGNTDTCRVCDEWMQDCIARCEKNPERRPVDRSLGSTTRLKSLAQGYLCLTSFLRAGAAAQAGNTTHRDQWMDVAGKQLKVAETTDPDNPVLKQLRADYDKALATTAPSYKPKNKIVW